MNLEDFLEEMNDITLNARIIKPIMIIITAIPAVSPDKTLSTTLSEAVV